VTSPPYWGLRDYKNALQIGIEKSPFEFIDKLVLVFHEVWRVLRQDGTLWVNIGDTYSQNGSGGHGKTGGLERSTLASTAAFGAVPVKRKIPTGLKSKELIGIPWRLAFALQDDGWFLRQDIIWHKPNPLPESVKDRCTKAHEYLFLLAKSNSYYFDHEAMQEPVNNPRASGNKRQKYTEEYLRSDSEEHRTKAGLMELSKVAHETRNRRSVWTIAAQPLKGAHFAAFPEALVTPCILAGCPEGETVLDPFCGSGRAGIAALKSGRRFIGIDLNPEYIEMARVELDKVDEELIDCPLS
jgi:DNA modification methylase